MLLSVTQAAAAIGLSPSVLRGNCAQRLGQKERVRIGNRWAVPTEVVILPPCTHRRWTAQGRP